MEDRKWSMIYLFTTTLVIATGMNLTISLVPLFLQYLGADVFQISLVTSVAGFASTLLTYFGGVFSDRYGRKLSICLGILLAAVPPFMYTLSTDWVQVIPWVILFNASIAFFSPARIAYIADRVETKDLGRVYGLMNIAWPVGGMIGPSLGGYLSDIYDWNAPFYFVTLISILSLLPAYLLQEGRRGEPTRDESEILHEEGVPIRKTLAVFFGIAFLISAGINATRPLLPLYLVGFFHLSRTEVGLFFTLSFGVITLITQLSASLIIGRYGSKRAMLHSVLLLPIAFVLLPWIDNYQLLILDYAVINGLWSVTWPTSMELLMYCIPSERRGVAAGIRQTGVRLANAVAPLMGAFLWEVFDPSFSFYASAAALILCVPLIVLVKEPETR